VVAENAALLEKARRTNGHHHVVEDKRGIKYTAIGMTKMTGTIWVVTVELEFGAENALWPTISPE
jgi:hypothetical protein